MSHDDDHQVNAPDGTPVTYESHVPTHREAEPLADPGLPPHTWRPTDVDPKAEKRAERQIAAMFIAAMISGLLFVVAYFSFEVGDSWDTVAGLGASTVSLGVTLGLSLLLIGIGIIHLARKLMADAEMVEMRHPAASPQEDRDATIQALNDGLDEAGIGRRPLVRNTMLGAVGVLGLPVVVLLRDLAPGDTLDIGKLAHTIWEPEMRLVRDVVGTPILASEIEVGDLINAAPEAMFPTEENGYPELEGAEEQAEKAKGAIIIVRMDPDELTGHRAARSGPSTASSATPRSAPTSGARSPSTSAPRTTCCARATSRPSTSPTPPRSSSVRLPVPSRSCPWQVDGEGYLVAQSDFIEPIGASYWEREKQ